MIARFLSYGESVLEFFTRTCTLPEAASLLGVSLDQVEEALLRGDLTEKTILGTRYVTLASLSSLISTLMVYQTRKAQP